jgi:hypothetical protein
VAGEQITLPTSTVNQEVWEKSFRPMHRDRTSGIGPLATPLIPGQRRMACLCVPRQGVVERTEELLYGVSRFIPHV